MYSALDDPSYIAVYWSIIVPYWPFSPLYSNGEVQKCGLIVLNSLITHYLATRSIMEVPALNYTCLWTCSSDPNDVHFRGVLLYLVRNKVVACLTKHSFRVTI